MFLIFYIDDILIIGNDIPTLQTVKIWLSSQFSVKDLGEATYTLGIRIYRDRSKGLLGLSQSTCIDKVLNGSVWISPREVTFPCFMGSISQSRCVLKHKKTKITCVEFHMLWL